MKRLIPALLALAITACSAPAPRATAAAPVVAGEELAPADPRLAELYNQSCKACHAAGGMGAPMAGDVAAWRPRMAKGMPALMQNVVSGINAMPAGGQCFSCSAADYEALIRFMATGKS